ncbi:YcjF family protein [Vibrio sp.]|uniref:YcjF family protein n=1 Tax=Vibrio sp. TaxID=678 RepID=UPI003D13272D
MKEIKSKQVFDRPLADKPEEVNLNPQQQFEPAQKFTPVQVEQQQDKPLEKQLEQVLRPAKRSRWWLKGILTGFVGLTGWQLLDNLYQSYLASDWLSLGWSGLVALVASLGVGALAKELWRLRGLKHHFNVQEQAEQLLSNDGVGQGESFCLQLAKECGVSEESPYFDRWKNSLNAAHSDSEILQLYDALVVAKQDQQATKIVSRYATEAAAMVAISPLALADMLLVAWRSFHMLDQLAKVYGVELGYWSRLQLFKTVLVNMALAGASELVIDAGMDLVSMDLAGKISARAGQGLGVGLLTARLGLKAMSLLRPLPWQAGKAVKISTIRKQIMEKLAAITVK